MGVFKILSKNPLQQNTIIDYFMVSLKKLSTYQKKDGVDNLNRSKVMQV